METENLRSPGGESSQSLAPIPSAALEPKYKPYVPPIFLQIANATGTQPFEVFKILNFLLPTAVDPYADPSKRAQHLIEFLAENEISEESFFTLCQHKDFSSALYRFAYYKYILPSIPNVMVGLADKVIRSKDPKDANAIYQLVEEFIPELRSSTSKIEEHKHLHLNNMNKKQLLDEVRMRLRKIEKLKTTVEKTIEGSVTKQK